MKATSRLRPSASSPLLVDAPSAITAPSTTSSPTSTSGFWWMSVPWLERVNLSSEYLSISPDSDSTNRRTAETPLTRPARRARQGRLRGAPVGGIRIRRDRQVLAAQVHPLQPGHAHPPETAGGCRR